MRPLPFLSVSALLGLMAFSSASVAQEATPAASRKGNLEFKIEPVTYAHYIRDPGARRPHLAFSVRGEVASEIRAARVVITRAADDTGRELRGPDAPSFLRVAVGSVSKDEYLRPIPPKIECDLSPVAPEAKSLRVEGMVELVIPAKHPDANVVITKVPAHAGKTFESKLLRQAGITLEIHDQRSYEARMTSYRNQSGGFTDHGMGIYFPTSMLVSMPPEARANLQKIADEQLARSPLPRLTDRDIALAIHDPEERLVGLEFMGGDNTSIAYNRNGWAHYSNNERKKRLALYRLEEPVPGDLKLVCWLAVNQSLVRIPFEMIDVPLPPGRPSLPKTPAPPATPNAP